MPSHACLFFFFYIVRELFAKKNMQENSARSQLGEFLELKTSTALASGCDGNYEKHLLNLFSIFSCQLYNSLRSKFFAGVNERYPIFNDLDKNLKIIFLFNNIDPFICRRRAAYVHLCMDLRQSLL